MGLLKLILWACFIVLFLEIAVPVILFLWWQSEIEVKETQRLASLGIES